jgi:uncharacterized NAD(P)/FAD-binding protein YdhS
MNKINELKSKA